MSRCPGRDFFRPGRGSRAVATARPYKMARSRSDRDKFPRGYFRAPRGRPNSAQATEAVKYSLKVQEHFPQRRRGAKKTNHLFSAVFASWRLCVRLLAFSQLCCPRLSQPAPLGLKGGRLAHQSATLRFVPIDNQARRRKGASRSAPRRESSIPRGQDHGRVYYWVDGGRRQN